MTTSRTEATRPGAAIGIVDSLLEAEVRARRDAGAVRVLDCGGGTGRYAVPLAAAGAEVTVVDVSADALSTLRRRAAEARVEARVSAVQGDVEDLASALAETAGAAGRFDLVLAHGVLQAVDDPISTFAAMSAALAPGALLSLLIANPVAVVLARALAGDLAAAERELAALDGYDPATPTTTGTAPVTVDPALVVALCERHGLVIEQRHGIGVFGDLVPGSALDEPGAREALARLESACARRSPFADIASAVHLLARRPHTGGPDPDGPDADGT